MISQIGEFMREDVQNAPPDNLSPLALAREALVAPGQQNAQRVQTLARAVFEQHASLEEYDFTFRLRWEADRRAILRWQEAHPGNDLKWPNHADLCVWLLGEIDRLEGLLGNEP
jgi:hypothetical protein